MANGIIEWHVLGAQITQSTTLAPGGGGIVDVYEVPYMIDSGAAKGSTYTISVPASSYNADEVKRLITVDVGTHHDVAGLTH
jgi:hypothetical protein